MNRRTFVLGLSTAVASGCAVEPSPAPPAPLRVMTYNLHHGEGGDGRLDLERIARVILAAQPDLVALQEIDRHATRTGQVDQASEYRRLTGMQGWFGAAMPFQGGEYGQMLLSRWPLETPRVLRLPGTPGREPRIAVAAHLTVPGRGKMRWVGVHLDANRDEDDRWNQAGALLEDLRQEPIPTLLAGDFNATPDSRVMQRLLSPDTSWEDTAGASATPTSPAETPRARIDYILASPRSHWRVLESNVLPEPVASDHRPLIAVFA